MAAFLLKTEPGDYSFDDLVRDGRATWDGIRNPEARNHLRAVKKGDLCLVYHTGDERQIVGVARALRAAFPDPGATTGDWLAIEVAPVRHLKTKVPLSAMKAEPRLADFALVRRGRLSVVPVSDAELRVIAALAATKL